MLRTLLIPRRPSQQVANPLPLVDSQLDWLGSSAKASGTAQTARKPLPVENVLHSRQSDDTVTIYRPQAPM